MTTVLTLLPLSAPPDSRRWEPFGQGADAHRGFREGWWQHRIFVHITEDRYYSVRDERHGEVARLELDWAFPIEVYPTAAAAATRPVVKIQFFEVREDLRLTGVGTAAIDLVLASFPNHQVMALSEQANGFWASLGWSRHRHGEYNGPYEITSPLFLAP